MARTAPLPVVPCHWSLVLFQWHPLFLCLFVVVVFCAEQDPCKNYSLIQSGLFLFSLLWENIWRFLSLDKLRLYFTDLFGTKFNCDQKKPLVVISEALLWLLYLQTKQPPSGEIYVVHNQCMSESQCHGTRLACGDIGKEKRCFGRCDKTLFTRDTEVFLRVNTWVCTSG